VSRLRRLLTPSAALLWGLQYAFLNPALALILVSVYGATASEVGWVLGIYNAGGFVASLLIPAWADRHASYLRWLLVAGTLTLVLAGVLLLVSALPVAVIALIVLGGPAGLGASLLYAHLRHSGIGPSRFTRVRAVFSFAWVAGPPLATLIIGLFGPRAILVSLAILAVLNIATTALLVREHRTVEATTAAGADDRLAVGRPAIAVIMIAFAALQATNVAVVSIMTLFVTETLGLDVLWAGVALGVAAALEIPALLVIGRLNERFSSIVLIISGAAAGALYYAGMGLVRGPVALLALQVLDAWFIAAVSGVGVLFYMQVIPRPGLASGLYANTRRIGAVVAGPVIALGSASAAGYRGVFGVCVALAVLGLAGVVVAPRLTRS
jgi:SET family sugar efflux transporter-like MFS transporter